MKRATAFILSIVYLAFALGGASQGTDIASMPYSYVAPISENEEADGISTEKAGDTNFISTGILLKQVHKHLATIAKVKLPRPGFVNINFTSFVPEHHSITGTNQLRTGTPIWAPAGLYLKNRVLLI
jgi:hypothetical protein